MATKPKKTDITDSTDEKTETFSFLRLPMKYREICTRFAVSKGYAHSQIVKMSFKIGKNDRMVHDLILPEK